VTQRSEDVQRGMKLILFVCTANICRSPMAAALMRRRIAELGLADQVEVQSAGVWARDGEEASAGAARALGQLGLSLADHRSQAMTAELLEKASIVLVMEEQHRRSLFYLEPKHLRKVFLLSEMAGRSEEIADPYGGPEEGYAATAEALDRLIAEGLPRILKRIGVTTKH
jgi:protein-tyrosine phosphatase